MTTFRHTVSTGMRWSATAHGGQHLLQLVTTCLLVGLLTPEEFGLVGMAVFFVGFVNLFHDLGTASALVQRRDLDQTLLSSVFWLNLGVAVLAGGAVVAGAPLAALFYGEARVEPILRVLSVCLVFAGLGTAHRALLRRDLAFRALARVELTAVATGAVAGIGGALLGFGVWSLVMQSLAISGVTTAGLWLTSRWRPSLRCSPSALRDVMSYGLNLTGFTVSSYIARNVDALIIGKMLGPAALGYYTLAYRLMLYPLRNVSAIVGRVMFPAYARISDDPARVRRVYRQVAAAIATITFPTMVGIAVLAAPIVDAIFGPAWAPAAGLLVILAPIGMTQSVGTTVGDLYLARGRTGLLFAWGAVSAVVTTAALAIGTRWGTTGVATAYVVASLLLLYPSFAIPFRLIDLRFRDFAAALRLPLLCALAMGAVLTAIDLGPVRDLPSGVRIACLVPVGVAVYAALVWTWYRHPVRELMAFALARPAARS